jgi:hypothetical protein
METIESDNNILGMTKTYSAIRYKSIVKGRNELLADGYKQCINPMYFQKGNNFAHYLKNTGRWVFEQINS